MKLGSCQCGAVEYEYDGTPLTCIACHCTDCQSASGSAFSISLVAQRADITIVTGALVDDSFPLNGNDLVRTRCAECAVALWYSNAATPEIVAIKPGTFKDTSWFTPVAHVWTRSAQPWLNFDSSIKTFPEQPELSELIELSQAQTS